MASKKTSRFNFTYVIVAVIFGFAILGYSFFNYLTRQSELNLEKERIDAETVVRTRDYYKQGDLDKCLEEAKAEFERLFDLNSTKGMTPGGQEARKWNSSSAKSDTEEKYNKDREFCLKLYK